MITTILPAALPPGPGVPHACKQAYGRSQHLGLQALIPEHQEHLS